MNLKLIAPNSSYISVYVEKIIINAITKCVKIYSSISLKRMATILGSEILRIEYSYPNEWIIYVKDAFVLEKGDTL